MKNILLTIILAISSTAVYSDDWREICASASGLAEMIMKNRQDGVPMKGMMQISTGDEVFEEMVRDAYNMPRFNTLSSKTKSIEDFRSSVFLSCKKDLN